MSHETYKELLQLAVLNELGDADARRLHEHLDTCAECQAEFTELTQMMTVIGESGVTEPTDEMLWEARRNLRASLSKEPSTNSVLARVTQSVAPAGSASAAPQSSWKDWFTGFRVGLTGLAGAAAGFAIAFLALGGETPTTPEQGQQLASVHEMGEPAIENVRFIGSSASRDLIEVQYELVRPVRLKAPATDERMVNLLSHAMTESPNTGVKLAAIKALDGQVEAKVPMDPDIKDAFVATLMSDANPAVRKQALRVLQRVSFDDSIRDACLYVLNNDNNPALRIAAINTLAEASLEGYDPGPELYDLLNENEDIRFHSGAFIKEVSEDVQ